MVFEKVRDAIVSQLGCDAEKVTEDALLIDDLKADSLDIVEMLMTFEDTYGFVIEDDDIATLRTVRDIVEYIENNA